MSETPNTEMKERPSELPVALHLLPSTARIEDGRLSVGGLDVEALTQQFGTPLFVYDEAHLRERCREAVAAFGRGAAYATKAFLCKAMATLAAEEGLHLDVSTAGELDVVRAAGVDPEIVVFHGNNKSMLELEQAVDFGVGRIVVDSFDEISRIAELNAQRPVRARISIRVTPGVEAHTHEFVMTGQEDSKFGFSVASGAATRAIEALRAVHGLTTDGVHAHIGSQILRLDAYDEEIAVLGRFLTAHQLEELSIGGGLGVAYLNDEQAPSIAEWAATVRSACDAAGIPAHVEVGAEPGRAIVARAALTCYTVGTIKELPGIRTYVAVDGGMSDNPRPVLYGSGYEAFIPTRADQARGLAVRIVGKHCESGDVLVSDARLPEDLAVGDLLATPVTGAYGYSMASNYNRIPRPAVVFVRDGTARLVLRRETPEDLLRLEP